MTSHTEMCEGCEVTSVEEGHDVERVTARSDVVKDKKSAGEAQPIGKEIPTDLRTKTDPTSHHRHDQLPRESKNKVSIEYVR